MVKKTKQGGYFINLLTPFGLREGFVQVKDDFVYIIMDVGPVAAPYENFPVVGKALLSLFGANGCFVSYFNVNSHCHREAIYFNPFFGGILTSVNLFLL